MGHLPGNAQPYAHDVLLRLGKRRELGFSECSSRSPAVLRDRKPREQALEEAALADLAEDKNNNLSKASWKPQRRLRSKNVTSLAQFVSYSLKLLRFLTNTQRPER